MDRPFHRELCSVLKENSLNENNENDLILKIISDELKLVQENSDFGPD